MDTLQTGFQTPSCPTPDDSFMSCVTVPPFVETLPKRTVLYESSRGHVMIIGVEPSCSYCTHTYTSLSSSVLPTKVPLVPRYYRNRCQKTQSVIKVLSSTLCVLEFDLVEVGKVYRN